MKTSKFYIIFNTVLIIIAIIILGLGCSDDSETHTDTDTYIEADAGIDVGRTGPIRYPIDIEYDENAEYTETLFYMKQQ